MNKVYLDKDGKLFVNGHEIKGVMVCFIRNRLSRYTNSFKV